MFAPILLLGQAAIPPASDLHDPAGQAILFKAHTLPGSVQVYTCKGGAWTGPDPDATVSSEDGKLTLRHFKGPTWRAADGSVVHGGNAKHFRAPRQKSVDWLELIASGGTKQFANVKLIHRIETSGGVAPATECDSAHDQQQVRSPYSAVYVFYGSKY
jgi:Protein of unknown function (DUF3455)